jgi:hypothetical protein
MLDQDYLKSLFNYNPETGVFTRLKSIAGGGLAGTDTVGSIDGRGYCSITIDGQPYNVSKLAFLYMEGYMPEYIDHENTIRSDNRWKNLRKCSKSENGWNCKLRVDNTTGVKGISLYRQGKRQGYRGRITANKKVYCKYFEITLKRSKEQAFEEATNWVTIQRSILHREFANHGIALAKKGLYL